MDKTLLLGYLASILTTTSFVPQVYKVWKTKSAKDISLTMFLMMTTGVTFWLIYGFLRNDLPILLGNIITLILCSIILFYKLREK